VANNEQQAPESDLPTGLAKPAQRALAGAGYVRLEQLAKLRKAEVMRLHGMGPKAFEQLRRALAAKGLAFADSPAAEDYTE
jgi:hypothetical protein